MKNKKYLVLYYVSFVVTLLFLIFSCIKYQKMVFADNGLIEEMFENVLGIVNIVLVILFSVLLFRKKNIQGEKVLFPIIYLCFLAIVVVMCFLFNNKVMVPYMHFEYYLFYVNIGFLFLNVYSLLLIKYKK